MNILYDDNMPYAAHYFNELGNAKGFGAGNLQEEDLANCHVLLVRSSTKVDAALIKKAPQLKYVATATAGFNHLSLVDINAANIAWYAAGGCNARAVAEYVLATLYALAERKSFALQHKTVAIVGMGNVGRTLASLLLGLDMHIIEYDPPRALNDKSFMSAQFNEVLGADIISLHVPLVTSGPYPTAHMFNADVLSQLNAKQILINACRGEVVDNQALLSAMLLHKDKMPLVCLDCWENEPNIDVALIPHLAMATAHIAGHSLEGKARGTDMVYQDLCRFLATDVIHQLSDFLPEFNAVKNVPNGNDQSSVQTTVSQTIKSMYDIENDDSYFRRHMSKSVSFSHIRSHYPVRREWPAAKIRLQNTQAASALKNIGFRLANDSK